jgi:uncharacterized protein YndB with AHSA1/START domain
VLSPQVLLHRTLRETIMSQDNSHFYELEISATPSRVWQALVSPDLTEKYYFNTRVDSDWNVGSKISYRDSQGRPAVEGKILEISPPGRLVTTFEPKWLPSEQAGAASTVVWEISGSGNKSKIKVTHEGLDPNNPATQDIQSAWPPTLDGLKSVLESTN